MATTVVCELHVDDCGNDDTWEMFNVQTRFSSVLAGKL